MGPSWPFYAKLVLLGKEVRQEDGNSDILSNCRRKACAVHSKAQPKDKVNIEHDIDNAAQTTDKSASPGAPSFLMKAISSCPIKNAGVAATMHFA